MQFVSNTDLLRESRTSRHSRHINSHASCIIRARPSLVVLRGHIGLENESRNILASYPSWSGKPRRTWRGPERGPDDFIGEIGLG